MEIYKIYKITNLINEKIYIGFTKGSLINRLRAHRYGKMPINCALKKYGIESFVIESIYESFDKNHTLNEMERYFIAKYNSRNIGYNLTSGGEGIVDWSPEMRSRQSLVCRGRCVSHETRLKLSASLKGRKRSPEVIAKIISSRAWYHHSDETKRKIGEAAKGKFYIRTPEINLRSSKAKEKFIWEITCPNGNKVICKNLKKFAQENNLCSKNLYRTQPGFDRKHHKNYTCRKLES